MHPSKFTYDMPSGRAPSVLREQVVNCIEQDCGNANTWSITDIVTTLTSFKTSTVLKYNPDIVKCLFGVDRKNLGRQTRADRSSIDKTSSKGEARRVSAGGANQFNRFQEWCVEENTNRATLVQS